MSFSALRTTAHALQVSKLHAYGSRRMLSAAPYLLSPREVGELTRSSPTSVSVLDSTWFMPNAPRKAKEEFLAKRIPTAKYLDLDEVASGHELGLKHMMPDPQTFAAACGMFFGLPQVVYIDPLRL